MKFLVAVFFLCICIAADCSLRTPLSSGCAPVAYPLRKIPSKYFFMISMPKSATHLVMKFWYLVTGQKAEYSYYCLYDGKKFGYSHFDIDHRHIRLLLNNPACQVVLNIRDPRDVCISVVDHLANRPNDWMNKAECTAFQQMSFDEQLLYVIQSKERACPLSYLDSVIGLMYHPRVVVCRFEDLVGPQGGGSTVRQMKQIETIARAFNIHLTADEVDALVGDIYGEAVTDLYGSTFRKGQIGSWKDHFKEVHKEACKRVMGKYLKLLGYETDDNW